MFFVVFGVFVVMELQQVQWYCIENFVQFVVVGVDEQVDVGYEWWQGMNDFLCLMDIYCLWVFCIEYQVDGIGVCCGGGQGVFDLGDIVDFDVNGW